MRKYLNVFIICSITAIAVWSIAVNIRRSELEHRNRKVELCLEASQMTELCSVYQENAPDFLARCRTAGVTAIVLSEEKLSALENAGLISFDGTMIVLRNVSAGRRMEKLLNTRYHVSCRNETSGGQTKLIPVFPHPGVPSFWTRDLATGFSEEKIRFYSETGFRIFLRPENAGDVQWLDEWGAMPVAGYVIDGKETPGYPGKEKGVSENIEREGLLLVAMEFAKPAGFTLLKKTATGNLVEGHTILQQELDRNTDTSFWKHRWVRAVRERGHRFLLVRLWNNKAPAENLRYLKDIKTALEQEGFAVAPASSPAYPAPAGRTVRLWGAMIAGLLFPLGGIWLLKHRKSNWLLSYILINGITLTGGLAISALLFDAYFMQRVMTVPAIKLLMVIPLVASAAILFKSDELVSFWNTQVRVKHLVIALLACAAIAVLLIRSGNTADGWLQADKGVRLLLENIFPVRPRTKEILFGQPLLLLGLYLGNPGLIWAGMIGQISIINTFYHVHSPVSVSLVRMIVGMVTGGLAGCVIVLLLKIRKKTKLPQ